MRTIIECIGEPAMLEQLAEECSELSKAALKMARIERRENPTPVTQLEAMGKFIEEVADVTLCIDGLLEYYHSDTSEISRIMRIKEKRFFQRWDETHEAH